MAVLTERTANRDLQAVASRYQLNVDSQAWSVQPCVRPASAVHMTAGHNALRGTGPGRKAFGLATLATRAVASAGPTPRIASSRLLASLERCQALIMRSNSRICAFSICSWARELRHSYGRPRAAAHNLHLRRQRAVDRHPYVRLVRRCRTQQDVLGSR